MPRLAFAAQANFHCLIHFRIGKRLMPALVPPPPAKRAHPTIQRLFKIQAKSILDRGMEWMRGDIGFESQT